MNDNLHDLVERGLLHFDDKNKKFDLHPIVRHYAYNRFTDSDRKNTHTELAMHFIDIMPITSKNIKTLEDLAPVIELYHHMVRAGNLDQAIKLLKERLAETLYYQFGAYQLCIELLRALFLDGEDKPPRLSNQIGQVTAMNLLESSYSLSGQPMSAIRISEKLNVIIEKIGDKISLATGIGNLGDNQFKIGALKEAERNLRRSIQLSKDIESDYWEGTAHMFLGYSLAFCGKWDESLGELNSSIHLFEKVGDVHMQSVSWGLMSVREMLIERSKKINLSHLLSALKSLSLAEDSAKRTYPIPRDFIRAYWLLGSEFRINNEWDKAEENLSKALNLCRQINMVDHEANILLDLARLRYDQKNFEETKSLAEEALTITERCSYVLQGADVNLFLALYTLEQEKDKAKAKEYAEEAKKLATCDGPPYYYKVAYEEAERFLENPKIA